MRNCLCILSVLTMIWSLAACGKAVSTSQVLSETEEAHIGYVDENQTPEIVDVEEITVRLDKINVGFVQNSNLYEWQVAQTESFYAAFMECDGYHLNIADAHGESVRQREQLEKLVDAPMDVLFIVPVDIETISDVLEKAKNSGIKVILLNPEETEAMSGDEARRRLENESMP